MAFISRLKVPLGSTISNVKHFSSTSFLLSKTIQEVIVIGGGLMGAGIAQVFCRKISTKEATSNQSSIPFRWQLKLVTKWHWSTFQRMFWKSRLQGLGKASKEWLKRNIKIMRLVFCPTLILRYSSSGFSCNAHRPVIDSTLARLEYT